MSTLWPVILVVFLAGCETLPNTQYRWGVYEDQLFRDYTRPGERSPQDAAQMLEADVAKTVQNGALVPPGVHAHLGYLHYLAGNRDATLRHLAREKELFPVSSQFVDTLLSNLAASGQ